MVAENINLISSLFAAQRFIFVQFADEVWLGKFDFVLKIFNNFLNDFKTQQAVESFDHYDHNIENKNVEMISSLLHAQRFIFTQFADEVWRNKFDIIIKSSTDFLSDFEQQLAVEECDAYEKEKEEKFTSKYNVSNSSDENECKREDSNDIKLELETEVKHQKYNCLANDDSTEKTNNKAHIDKEPIKRYCLMCNEDFSSILDRNQHFTENHFVNNRFQCAAVSCEKTFASRHYLCIHFETIHTNRTQSVCQDCGGQFKTKRSLEQHIEKEHINVTYACDQCPNTFNVKYLFHRHLRTHNEGSNFKCEVCGKVYSSPYLLTQHLAESHKIGEEMKCNECDKVYLHKQLLKRHITNVHKDCNRFVCEKCDYRCPTKYMLKSHQVMHTGDEARTLECRECGLKFKQKAILDVHIRRTHEKVKNHWCQSCGKGFYQKTKLIQHIKIHTGDREFSCKFCDKEFIQKSNRDTHQQKCHSSLTLL